jgi:decaprenylphospho-beta-D-ribofuranose 2-oxidase
MMLSGWGRFPKADGLTRAVLRAQGDAGPLVADRSGIVARGNGRSYGDASLGLAGVIDMRRLDRLIAFDETTGRLTCEAGLMLADLLEFSVPRGFFPPVTPGTKFVTIGGMIASDVHGKNHHGAGSFGRHIESLDLLTADGQMHRCSATEEPELFQATCGGMGLTGVILAATFRLIRIETPLIRQETFAAANLDEAIRLFEASGGWTYTVAWIDCLARGDKLGRSLLYRGEHATQGETGDAPLVLPVRRRRSVPVDLPGGLLNRWSVAAFNELYYRRGKPGTSYVDYDTYFYPLDAILDWNRIYGRAGFVQYQCVIPKTDGKAGLTRLLDEIAAHGRASFLAVLKLFGPGDAGYLSFPMEGYTLALDFPADSASFSLLRRLDTITAAHGGRIYLTKDACSGAALLRQGYPQLDRFRAVRAAVDPNGKFASLLSKRLDL